MMVLKFKDNEENQLSNIPIDGGYIAIACGASHSVALKNDGTIKSWGDNDENQLYGVPEDGGYVAIAQRIISSFKK